MVANLANQLYRIVSSTVPHFRAVAGYEGSSVGFDRIFLGVDCDEIYSDLFVGNAGSAQKKAYLCHLGVTHVLNTAEGQGLGLVFFGANYYHDCGIQYKGLPVLDHPCSDLSQYFVVASEFIDSAIRAGGKVLVHCVRGQSRSACVAIAYLMLKVGMPAPMALRLCCLKRSIQPNIGFVQQLANLHVTLQCNNALLFGNSML